MDFFVFFYSSVYGWEFCVVKGLFDEQDIEIYRKIIEICLIKAIRNTRRHRPAAEPFIGKSNRLWLLFPRQKRLQTGFKFTVALQKIKQGVHDQFSTEEIDITLCCPRLK
jgi:hypothetical protein